MNATKTANLTYTTADYRGEAALHHILVIEYHRGQPHSVVTDLGTFDFEWCQQQEAIYFRKSGGGMDHGGSHGLCRFCEPSPPPGQLWTAPDITLHEWKSDAETKAPIGPGQLLEMGYLRIKEPLWLKTSEGSTRNPFEAGEEYEGHFEYCSICDTMLSDDCLCDHIYHSDCGDPVGAGSEEPSQDSMFAALDWLAEVEGWQQWCIGRQLDGRCRSAVHALERKLLDGMFKRVPVSSDCMEGHFKDTFDDDETTMESWQECEDGLGWLTTLGTDTPEANSKTLRWIMAWRLSRRERAGARQRKETIKELLALCATQERRAAIAAALGIPGKDRQELDEVSTARIRQVVEAFKEF